MSVPILAGVTAFSLWWLLLLTLELRRHRRHRQHLKDILTRTQRMLTEEEQRAEYGMNPAKKYDVFITAETYGMLSAAVRKYLEDI